MVSYYYDLVETRDFKYMIKTHNEVWKIITNFVRAIKVQNINLFSTNIKKPKYKFVFTTLKLKCI